MSKYTEAIAYISGNEGNKDFQTVWYTIYESLEKQVKKNTIKTDFFDSGCCPNCERCISWIKNEYFNFNNCPYCGQSIDWESDTE